MRKSLTSFLFLYGLSVISVPAQADLEAPAADSSMLVPEFSSLPWDLPPQADEPNAEPQASPLSVNYYAVAFGPSLLRPSAYQPNLRGEPDSTRPIMMKNFLSAGYAFNSRITLSATAYGIWQPTTQEQFLIQDPFLMVSDNSLLHWGNLNLYSDFRLHLPVTTVSQFNNLILGIQTFQALSYAPSESRFSVGLNCSLRTNFYGSHGWGTDVEAYLSPYLRYQASPVLALAVSYEAQASHWYGVKPYLLQSDGTAIQPGLSWDALPNVNINPFLMVQTGKRMSLMNTALGVFLSWGLL